MMDTMVLSNGYEYLRRVSWQRAISLWFDGKVEIVLAYTDRTIRTVGETIPMPAVVRFLGKVAKRWFKRGLRFTRENVWLRDKGKCAYCACAVTVKDMTYDHVVPRSQGGATSWTNIVASCKPCNRKKGDRTLLAAGLVLRSVPIEPKALPSPGEDHFVWREGMPLEWKEFSAA